MLVNLRKVRKHTEIENSQHSKRLALTVLWLSSSGTEGTKMVS